jgi:gas vesicle protein
MDRGATATTGRIYYSVEAERQAHKERNRSIAVAALIGLTIGGILASIMGPGMMPKREKNMREKIADGVSETTSDALKKLENQYNGLKDQVEKMMGSIRG